MKGINLYLLNLSRYRYELTNVKSRVKLHKMMMVILSPIDTFDVLSPVIMFI